MTTYLLHVAGKTIGRESGLRPIPVQADSVDDRQPFADVILATVRRCLPYVGNGTNDARIQWDSKSKARVVVYGAGAPWTCARFTIKPATAADHAVGVPQLPKV